PSVGPSPGLPYARRSRSELTALLHSTAATASGLPEAVVARIALGAAGIVSTSGESGPDVAERLLSGELPVRIDDLPYLARSLGVNDASRVTALEERLRRAPEASSLPEAPAFRRVLTARQTVESWGRKGGLRVRYDVGFLALLRRAGVEGRARPATPSDRERTLSVPEITGLRLAIFTDET